MARSPFYARIKSHVLIIAAAIPAGRVATSAEIGDWLDVPARHVAYIVATLTLDERMRVPWYRVVPASGFVASDRHGGLAIAQRELLRGEGVTIAADGRISNPSDCRVRVTELSIDLPPQSRPSDAPATVPRARRRFSKRTLRESE